MPTAKDMEFAKQLITKDMISKAEIQRHLDDLDAMCQSGKNLTLEQLLIQRKIISPQELRFIQGPKKRIVHCSKCNTMYRAREEDIGKKFKCKQCGTFVIVPLPGQTEVRPVKEIQKKTSPVAEEIDTQKVLREVPKASPVAQTPPATTPKAPTTQEMTILLGLEENQAQESQPEAVVIDPESPVEKQEEPEMTIMLDLDDEDDESEAIEISPDPAEFDADPVPQVKAIVIEDEAPTDSDINKQLGLNVNSAEEPEMTIMLDLDDEDDTEEETLVEQEGAEESSVSEEGVAEEEAVAITEEMEEWALTGYGGEGAEELELKPEIPTAKPVENKAVNVDLPEELDEWAISGYGGEEAASVEVETKIDKAVADKNEPVLSYQEMQALSKWADSNKKGAEAKAVSEEKSPVEGKKQVDIVTPLKKDSQKLPPKAEEMTIVLGLDEDDDDDDDELAPQSAPMPKPPVPRPQAPASMPKPPVPIPQAPASMPKPPAPISQAPAEEKKQVQIVSPAKKNEGKIPPKAEEMTIVLGLDDEDDDE